MNCSTLLEELCNQRDWHVSEIACYKSIPHRYANPLFNNIKTTYWKMCVPMIYAHWESYVISSFRIICDYINDLQIKYSDINNAIAILSNKTRFSYLSGNIDRGKQARFYSEFVLAYGSSVYLESNTCVTAKSNLNFKQLSMIFNDFGIQMPQSIEKKKIVIEKMVTYRNKIAHGENSVTVQESDILMFANCTVELIDEIILIIKAYLENESYLKSNHEEH